jgi:putative ATP-dependent endonuclease of OLD family
MLPIDVQVALRDAEKDLASWRNSPLRPLIEDLAASLDDDAREEIQDQVDQAQRELAGHEEVVATAERISERLIAIAGGNMPFRYRSDLHQLESTRCCAACGC